MDFPRYRFRFCPALVFGLVCLNASAEIAYTPFLLTANNSAGTPIANGTYVLVLDLDGDGWNGNDYDAQPANGDSSSTWLWDTGDILMDRGQITDGMAAPTYRIQSDAIPPGYDVGVDEYYILWFDTPYVAAAAGPGVGVAYGAESLGTAGADPGTYTPVANGGNVTLQTVSGSAPVNNAPILQGMGDQGGNELEELTFTINAEDPDGDDLTLSVTGLPDGIGEYVGEAPTQASPATWTFAWTPGEGDDGAYNVEFEVTDGDLNDTESLTLTVNEVNQPPVFDAMGDQTEDEGDTVGFTLTATDGDLPANDLTFGHEGALPTGATLDDETGVFNWPTAEADDGSHTITFTVDDGQGGQDTMDVTIDVTEVNTPPSLSFAGIDPAQTQQVAIDGTLTFDVAATDPDVPANDLRVEADTNELPAGPTYFAGGTFTWTPSAGEGGSYDVTFTVQDDFTPPGTDQQVVTIDVVENHAPVARQPRGLLVRQANDLTITLTGQDEDGDSLTYTVDAASAEGAVIDNADPESPAVVYSAPADFVGIDTFSYSVSDGFESSADQTVYVSVLGRDAWFAVLEVDGTNFSTLALGAELTALDDYAGDVFDVIQPDGDVLDSPTRDPGASIAGLYRPPAADPQAVYIQDIRKLDGDDSWVLGAETAAGSGVTIATRDLDVPAGFALGIVESDADGTPLAGESWTELTPDWQLDIPANSTAYYAIGPMRTSIELDLLAGWNLVSIPLIPDSPAVDDVFSTSNEVARGGGFRDGSRGIIYTGDIWDWLEIDQIYAALTGDVAPYQGYWVYVDEATTLRIEGIAAIPPRTFHQHWNLIGAGEDGTTVTSFDDIAYSVWRWFQDDYELQRGGTPTPVELLRGFAYWFYSYVDGAPVPFSGVQR